MKLSLALGFTGGECVAFVGAGGKTSALFALAGELSPPVVLTTTTHLGAWQAQLADQHQILTSPEALNVLDLSGVKTALFTGPLGQDQRLGGLDPHILNALYQICREHGYTLLVEADGARQRPLKAPAAYEPVIPEWVDHVVVMAGLSGIGQPLAEESVHRPEIYAYLAELPLGEVIGVEQAARVLAAPSGGLKGIPEGARRFLFLNQAEDDLQKARGLRLANLLTAAYDRILIGSLKKPGQDGPVFSAHSKTAGIILAAGGSERLGQPKQLLDWCGKPFVSQVAQSALTAGLAPVIVVTGAHRGPIEAALADLLIRCVFNPDWVKGQSTSMRVGLRELPPHCDRAMFLLSDQPQISPFLIRGLIERHNVRRAPITAPMMRERRGNPVLFGCETFGYLGSVEGDKGGRAAFNAFRVDHVPWVDDRCLLDVDQARDFEQLIDAYFGIE